MIDNHQLAWMKEFLLELCNSEDDKMNALEIFLSMRKLWHVAIAAKENPYPRSAKLEEALASIKKHAPPDSEFQ